MFTYLEKGVWKLNKMNFEKYNTLFEIKGLKPDNIGQQQNLKWNKIIFFSKNLFLWLLHSLINNISEMAEPIFFFKNTQNLILNHW